MKDLDSNENLLIVIMNDSWYYSVIRSMEPIPHSENRYFYFSSHSFIGDVGTTGRTLLSIVVLEPDLLF
jgi:hypothetical protein